MALNELIEQLLTNLTEEIREELGEGATWEEVLPWLRHDLLAHVSDYLNGILQEETQFADQWQWPPGIFSPHQIAPHKEIADRLAARWEPEYPRRITARQRREAEAQRQRELEAEQRRRARPTATTTGRNLIWGTTVTGTMTGTLRADFGQRTTGWYANDVTVQTDAENPGATPEPGTPAPNPAGEVTLTPGTEAAPTPAERAPNPAAEIPYPPRDRHIPVPRFRQRAVITDPTDNPTADFSPLEWQLPEPDLNPGLGRALVEHYMATIADAVAVGPEALGDTPAAPDPTPETPDETAE